jgi:subtilisin family serine protease
MNGVIATGATYDADLGREPDSGYYSDYFGSSFGACYDASSNINTIACFTNSNAMLDILAPGARITAPYNNGFTATWTGTSASSAAASGVAALLLEGDPGLTPTQIESTLESTGVLSRIPEQPDLPAH